MVFKRLLISIIFLILVSNVWAKGTATIVKDGNDNYRNGQYEEALSAYNQALTQGGQDNVARYNLGNALYRKAEAQVKTNIDGAIADVAQAIKNYEEVVTKAPKNDDAKYNLDVAKRELEKLKQQKKEQEKQKENQKDKNDKKHQNDKKDKNDSKDQQDQDKDKSENQEKNKQNESKDDKQKQEKQEQDAQDQEKEEKEKKDKEKSQGQDQKDDAKQDQGQKDQNKGEPGEGEDAEEGKPLPGQLSKKEAKDILEDYERNEEPKGLLNFIQKSGSEQPVSKDW